MTRELKCLLSLRQSSKAFLHRGSSQRLQDSRVLNCHILFPSHLTGQRKSQEWVRSKGVRDPPAYWVSSTPYNKSVWTHRQDPLIYNSHTRSSLSPIWCLYLLVVLRFFHVPIPIRVDITLDNDILKSLLLYLDCEFLVLSLGHSTEPGTSRIFLNIK